jgi:hypothetical protein
MALVPSPNLLFFETPLLKPAEVFPGFITPLYSHWLHREPVYLSCVRRACRASGTRTTIAPPFEPDAHAQNQPAHPLFLPSHPPVPLPLFTYFAPPTTPSLQLWQHPPPFHMLQTSQASIARAPGSSPLNPPPHRAVEEKLRSSAASSTTSHGSNSSVHLPSITPQDTSGCGQVSTRSRILAHQRLTWGAI